MVVNKNKFLIELVLVFHKAFYSGHAASPYGTSKLRDDCIFLTTQVAVKLLNVIMWK